MSWQAKAACGDPDVMKLFFGPDDETQFQRTIRQSGAKVVCASCPVRAECLDYALRSPVKYGVWGGLNTEELSRERRRQARRASAA